MPLVMIKGDKKAREKPCLRCGYSLRRIESLHCPECGLSTWRSLNSNDALEWSNPPWLARVSMACAMLAGMQLVGLAAYVLMNLLSFRPALHFEGLMLLWFRGERWYRLVAGGYEMGLAVCLWMLAGAEGRHPDKWKPYRLACRIVSGLLAVVAVWMFISGATRWGMPAWSGWIVARMMLTLSIIAGTLTSFAYLRKLAQRIPNSRVVWWSGCLLLAPAVSLLKAVPIFSIFLAFEFSGLLFTYLPLIYLPVTVVLLVWFAVALRKASVAAAAGWEAETAG
jgi:hypothetical protein